MTDDLNLMRPAEAGQLREIASAWESYGPAVRAKLTLDGGMQWKSVNGAQYLSRYRADPQTSKKKFTSLGRRSRETEAIYRDFIDSREAARRTVLNSREGIALAGRVAKAHGLARMPVKTAEIIRAFWSRSMDLHLTLFGGAALFAYEQRSEVLAPYEIARDDSLLFIFDGAEECTTADIVEAYEDAVGAKASAARRGNRLLVRSEEGLRLEVTSLKSVLREIGDDRAGMLGEAFDLPAIKGLAVARDAQPVELTAPDPRAYAAMAYVLGQDDEVWADRARFAATLVRERWPEKFEPQQEEALPELCLDPDGERRFYGP
jgi:hypothetical protein